MGRADTHGCGAQWAAVRVVCLDLAPADSHHHDVLAVRCHAAGLQRCWHDGDLLAAADQGNRVGELIAYEDGLAHGGSVVRLVPDPGIGDHLAARVLQRKVDPALIHVALFRYM